MARVEDDLRFRVEEWDAAGAHVVTVLAISSNALIAAVAFAKARELYPKRLITLRNGARVIEQSGGV